jgi:hypothetical protein
MKIVAAVLGFFLALGKQILMTAPGRLEIGDKANPGDGEGGLGSSPKMKRDIACAGQGLSP